MRLVIAVLICVLVRFSSSAVLAKVASRGTFCDVGKFLDIESGKPTCRNCTTTCPANQIIRRTCSTVRDAVCGPFFEFLSDAKSKRGRNSTAKTKQMIHQLGNPQYQDTTGAQAGKNLLPCQATLKVNATSRDPAKDACKQATDELIQRVHVYMFGIAGAAFVVLLTLAAIAFIRAKISGSRMKKASLHGAGGIQDNPNYPIILSRLASRPLNNSLIHIESQVLWNSRRRGPLATLLTGNPRASGNEYVDEKNLKVLLSSANPPPVTVNVSEAQTAVEV